MPEVDVWRHFENQDSDFRFVKIIYNPYNIGVYETNQWIDDKNLCLTPFRNPKWRLLVNENRLPTSTHRFRLVNTYIVWVSNYFHKPVVAVLDSKMASNTISIVSLSAMFQNHPCYIGSSGSPSCRTVRWNLERKKGWLSKQGIDLMYMRI